MRVTAAPRGDEYYDELFKSETRVQRISWELIAESIDDAIRAVEGLGKISEYLYIGATSGPTFRLYGGTSKTTGKHIPGHLEKWPSADMYVLYYCESSADTADVERLLIDWSVDYAKPVAQPFATVLNQVRGGGAENKEWRYAHAVVFN